MRLPLPEEPSQITPAYGRASWIVIALDIGYGLIEMAGGFLAGSQAVEADALDFLGDGLTTIASTASPSAAGSPLTSYVDEHGLA